MRLAQALEGTDGLESANANLMGQVTLVWDDPVNLMSYVTYVFQQLFGFSRDEATKLMLDVHHKGRAVVTSGSRDKVEIDVAKLHGAGLWATMQKDA